MRNPAAGGVRHCTDVHAASVEPGALLNKPPRYQYRSMLDWTDPNTRMSRQVSWVSVDGKSALLVAEETPRRRIGSGGG
jgi:hypothetical protein